MKHIKLTFLLAMLMSMVGVASLAHDIEVANDDGVTIYYKWTNNNTELAVSYQGTNVRSYSNEYTGKIVIPEIVTYEGASYKVTSIGNSAFNDCGGLVSLEIPNSVNSIGDGAFYDCSSLTSIEIPNGVTTIGSNAFNNCSGLTSLIIPLSVTSIGNYAFCRCNSIVSITIPSSVNSIGSSVFSGCSALTSIEIPNSVTNIGDGAFSGCSGLTSIEIPNSVTNIGDGAFSGCRGLTSIEIPNSVTNIGRAAFYGCSGMTSIEIPNSVVSLGSETFRFCSGLTSIIIPKKVTSIGDYTFEDCSSLVSIIISENVTRIGDHAFSGCSGLISIIIPERVTSIGDYAFNGCSSLTSIEISKNVKSIGSCAFQVCGGLTSINIPNSVTSIGSFAFSGCKGLTSIIIPSSVTSIGGCAFNACSGLTSIVVDDGNPVYDSRDNCNAIIESLSNTLIMGFVNTVIPSSVTSIGNSAFANLRDLTNIEIPNSVTRIGERAFEHCSGLTSIEIPNGVTSIGFWAFHVCGSLTNVAINSNDIMSKTYTSSSNLNTIFGNQVKEFVIGSEVTSVGNYAFYNGSNLNGVTLGSGVTSIGANAFDGCTALADLTSWATIPPVCEGGALTGISKANCTLTIPNGSLARYQAAGQWKDFTKIVEANNSVNMLILPDLSAYVAKQALLNVGMANDDAITGMQFKLTVPTGVTVAEDNKGKLMLSKTERDEDHTLDGSKNEDGTYTILLFSNGSDAIIGNAGDIIGITLDVSNTLAEGDYEIKLSDIVLSTTNAKKINLEDITSVLSVSVMNGDVNNDGDVDVVDVTAVANYILGQQPTSFMVKAADADYDGVIDVNDIVSIANIILYGNTTGASNAKRKAKSSTIMEANNDGIFVNNLTMQKGETSTLDFELVNMDHAYSGVQFEIQLPEGLSFALNDKGKVKVTKGDRLEDEEFTLSVAPQGENRYKVLGYYSDASSIPEHGGVLFSLSLVADENAPSGDARCNVTDVVLSTPDAQKIKPANKTFTVTIADPSGINTITMDDGTEMEIKETFDINGKKTTGLQRGLNIVKLKNGTLFKVVVK